MNDKPAAILDVIIPTRNEAARLPALVAQLRAQRGAVLRIVACDGGSEDETIPLAERFADAVVVSAPGRGAQMNAGADAAQTAWLLFLHADSGLTQPTLLADALTALRQRCKKLGHDRVAGHFPLRFTDACPDILNALRFHELKSALNRLGCINGDQGLLISRRFFSELGGFDDTLGYLEDQKLAARIFAQGQWMTLPGALETSARRFEQESVGPRRALNALIMTAHHTGLESFFPRAADAYREQSRAERLNLTPFVSHFLNAVGDAGVSIGIRRWGRVGRYLAANLWQLALLAQQRTGKPWLARFDRWLAPGLDSTMVGWLLTPLAWGALHALRFGGAIGERYRS
ncbi:glycosyltransferase [Magnetofaba australis]|uniref:Putative glycosyl transferase family protein n=1 Tax=Magnetofaba australis IT-1 TaxID=1434232 RepID=A0A1Y2K2R1_9PROT|nr:glycosyltransferase [Magnetofaba australis]OSM02320.1 putative glycosyl transferase family protein [Magnetofaba australis IT-1]